MRSTIESQSDDGQPPEVADAIPGWRPDGHVIVGAEIRLRDGSALQCDSVDMADTAEVEAALKLSRKAFATAKGRIARRTHVSSAVLKVMAGIQGDCMMLSVVIDQRHMSDELMEKFEIVSHEITKSLRNALVSRGATLTSSEVEGAGLASKTAAEPTGAEPDPKSPLGRPRLALVTSPSSAPSISEGVDPSDVVEKRFREGLLAINRPGTLTVSLVANGKPDEAGPMKLVSSGRNVEPVRRRESKSQRMTGFVHTFNRSGRCRFKKDGSTAQVDAEFPTDDAVAMHLRLASDGPAVMIEYHQYKDASDRDVCIQITKLVGLSAPWAGVTGAFANLARAVEALKKLLPKGRKDE
jgi:hypothetical protein